MYMSEDKTEQNIAKSAKTKMLAIGVGFIVLAACLVGAVSLAFINSNNLQTQITTQENTIRTQNQTIQNLNMQIAQAPDISVYTSQIQALQSQISDLNDSNTAFIQILDMRYNDLIYKDSFIQDANATTALWNDAFDYGGYIVVTVHATANSTYVQTAYNYGTNYSYNVTQIVGQSGTVAFPIVPNVGAVVLVGNVNENNNGNATIAYHY
jgi:hypothetical protein